MTTPEITTLLTIGLFLSGCVSQPTPSPSPDEAAFKTASDGKWKSLFFDACTGDPIMPDKPHTDDGK